LPRPTVDDQLLFQDQVFSNDGFTATRSKQLCDGGEQVKK